MEKELMETRLAELSKDIADASTFLKEQKENIDALQIKIHRMEGARFVLKEILDLAAKVEASKVE